MTPRVAPDLPGLPGVPASIGPLTCPDCGQRTATVHHAPEGNDSYAALLACGNCGAVYELEATAYAAGLAAGVLAERARSAEPEARPCSECGSLLAYSHNDGCPRA